MRLLRGNSFGYKMMLMALLASSLALGTLTAAFLVFDYISSRSLTQGRLSTLANIVGQNSAAALDFQDPHAANEVLQALRAEPTVVSACLYDSSGRQFAQYQRQPRTYACPTDSKVLNQASSDYSVVVRPVLRNRELVGTLFLKSDFQDFESRWRYLLQLAAALLILALLVAGLSGSILQRRISKPLSELTHAMNEVTVQQDFAARVSVSGNDEIAQLGVGFNTMLSELERRDLEKREAQEKLKYQAVTDELTGLPNRRLLADRLSQALAVARRERHILALLYLDLDGFKLVNDSLGHTVGDVLLGQVSGRLRSRARQSDTLARLGGDEFTVVLTHLRKKEEAGTVAQSLLDVLAAPFIIEGHEITIGASIGISCFPADAVDGVNLLQQADNAMYAAKRQGRNRAIYFTPELGSSARERLNLENQLRSAISRCEIAVHYQPEFELATHRVVRFEALARWTHPTLGTIPPAKFIPIAEETGMIIPLGLYVMARACAEAVTWQKLSPVPIQVAVNVSSIQFARDNFVEEVAEVLRRTGLNPGLLQIELTESVMLSGADRVADTMRRLRALGVSLAIDDFGTGYSCLSYLPKLPFDALKIDRSFVQELESRPGIEAMVHSLVTLAHNLGMRVIVEGVETSAQLELIRKFGSNEVQGFLLGRPTPDPASHLAAAFPGKQQAYGGSQNRSTPHESTNLPLPD
jgi:diguanylate cyclase (GGDEF)-like protein